MNPRIRRQFSVIAHSADAVELRQGVWNPVSFALRDESESGCLTRTVLRLDGSSPIEEIARSEGLSVSDVERVVQELDTLGVLETTAQNIVDLMLSKGSYGAEGCAAEQKTRYESVHVFAKQSGGGLFEKVLSSALPQMRVHKHSEDSPLWNALNDSALSAASDILKSYQAFEDFGEIAGSIVVFLSEEVDPVRSLRLNRVCMHHRVPWFHAGIDGPFIFIGPLTLPYRSACFECFERRVAMNLRESASYLAYKSALFDYRVRRGHTPAGPIFESLLAAHSVMEATNFAVTGYCATIGKVLSIYTPTMEFAYHDVLRVPNCIACGPQLAGSNKELYFDHTAVSETGTAPK